MRTSEPGRSPRTTATAGYSTLLKTIKAEGLLDRAAGFYIKVFSVLAVLTAGTGAAMAVIGDSWFQLIPAAVLGILFTQFAFLAHEASHRQVFSSGPANDKAGRLIANLIVGISYQWWMNKHNRHHANPNTIGKDPDIEQDTVSFLPEQAQARSGFMAWLTRRQGWAFFPLLTGEGVNLHVQSIKYLFTARKVQGRATELAMVFSRLGLYTAAVFVFLPAGKAAAFLAVQLAVFGVYMGASFAPNHKGMPLIPEGSRIDFLSRQVLTSRNITGRFTGVFMGGLNYQAEHHLFPSMPRPHLARAAELTRAYCQEQKIPYTETTLLRSYANVITYLNKVGLSGRDPFECPMVSAYRPS
ncbi:fatty acid desaturase family protein [Arthrobacter caoxuetaonis]|uniref:Acyl-CoA desaturase n=1 Tax=Arthrobacter caoxuetaonis TaxID=2886935 RepID=A0A9X1MFU2_9MICC|nr:acyl-CoA desaturase [Arthrobacter caoxuetaonis]MCC3299304.1 acyl-CoA desaturase [Arthrobacter caoxuetaonis]USQ59203.1 acyl-CoA desaturase [Arthrobacter caoxuetaonis]